MVTRECQEKLSSRVRSRLVREADRLQQYSSRPAVRPEGSVH